MKKFLLITTVIIAVLIITLILFIKIYVTPEKVKEFVVPTAEESLNRKINIGDVSINIFKGIGLKDFSVKEADQKTDFVTCKDFFLKFKLLPLLSKKVVIDELKLVSPEISVIRNKDGKYNFEDIGQKKEAEKVKEEKQAEEAEGLPISLLVNKVAIDDARFSLNDLMKELPDIKSSADINISIKSIDGTGLSTQGSIDLTLEEVVMKKPSEKKIKDITANLEYAVHINLESKDIRIDRADIKIQEIPVSLKGEVKKMKTSPEIDIEVSLPKVKTGEIQKLAAIFTDMKGLSLSGKLAADVKLKGALQKMDSLKANGSILLEKIGIKYNEIDALIDGNIKFDEKVMNINLKSTLDKNTAELKGSVRNYFKNQNINLDIYSKKLSLDEIIPPEKAEARPPAQRVKPAPQKAPKEAEPVDLELTARGEIKIDSAVYKGMTMSNFYTRYQFTNNKLKITEMTANAGKGKFDLTSVVDISKPGYRYNLSSSLDSLHADEVVNSLFPKAQDTVFGLLSFNLTLNGSGTLPENIKKNLVADGDFNIKDGKITNAKIAENLSRFLDINELETINLKEAKGTVRIRNSVAKLDSVFTSDDISMDPSGKIGLDETLDLDFDLKLSPHLTDKAMRNSSIAQYIKNEEGWGMIPLKVSGTFANPSYTVDIAKAGKRVIKKKADKFIDKLFDKKEEEKKQELEPVKDLLKGIFK